MIKLNKFIDKKIISACFYAVLTAPLQGHQPDAETAIHEGPAFLLRHNLINHCLNHCLKYWLNYRFCLAMI